MQRNILAILIAVLLIAPVATFIGCDTESSNDFNMFPTEPQFAPTLPDGDVDLPTAMVKSHRETLKLVHKYDDEADLVDAAHRAANELAAKYGEREFTREEVEYYLAEGARMATMSTEDVVAQVLDPESEDYKWYMAFVAEATPETVEEDLEAFIKKRPLPKCQVACAPSGDSPSTMAANRFVVSDKLRSIVGVTVDSAQYWREARKHHEFVTPDPRSGEQGGGGVHLDDDDRPWWKKALQRVVFVSVDAVGGFLGGFSPIGPFGAGIAAGLCSVGVDHIFYSDHPVIG